MKILVLLCNNLFCLLVGYGFAKSTDNFLSSFLLFIIPAMITAAVLIVEVLDT
jgi:hypothetical protein